MYITKKRKERNSFLLFLRKNGNNINETETSANKQGFFYTHRNFYLNKKKQIFKKIYKSSTSQAADYIFS